MFAWLSSAGSASASAARTAAVAARNAAQIAGRAVKQGATTAAEWTKTAAAKVGPAVKNAAVNAKDWAETPFLTQSQWFAREAGHSVAKADKAYVLGDAQTTNFELAQSSMDTINSNMAAAGAYPQFGGAQFGRPEFPRVAIGGEDYWAQIRKALAREASDDRDAQEREYAAQDWNWNTQDRPKDAHEEEAVDE